MTTLTIASELVQTTTNLHIRDGRSGSSKSLVIAQTDVMLWPVEKTPANSWLNVFLVGWRKGNTLYSEPDKRSSIKAINLSDTFSILQSENGFDQVQITGYCWTGNASSPTYIEVKGNA